MEKKWYRGVWTKAILIALAHVMAVSMVVGTIWAASYPNLISEYLDGNVSREYEDSSGFNDELMHDTYEVMAGMSAESIFETEGKFNPDKIVDIEKYSEAYRDIGDGSNQSGLSYRLGDLLEWGDEAHSYVYHADVDEYVDEKGEWVEEASQIEHPIVCKRSDGTYQYYKMSEFQGLIEDGTLQFVFSDGELSLSANEVLKKLGEEDSEFKDKFRGIQDAEGKILYLDCWKYDGNILEEKYAPIGADSVIQIVNENPKWNGRLSEAYKMISTSLADLTYRYDEYTNYHNQFEDGNTNYFYYYADLDTGYLRTNREAFASISYKDVVDQAINLGKYVVVRPKLRDFQTNTSFDDVDDWKSNMDLMGDAGADDYIFVAGVDTTYPVHDSYYKSSLNYEKYSQIMVWVMGGLACAMLIFLLCTAWLIIVAGRSANDNELHLNAFDRWKTEVAAASLLAAWLIPTGMIFSIGFRTHFLMLLIGGGWIVFTCAIFLTGVLSLTRRIKAKTVWSNSLLRMFCKFLEMIAANIHSLFKVVIGYGIFMLVQWMTLIVSSWDPNILWLVLFVMDVLAFILLIHNSIGRIRIKEGITRIAGGEVDYKIDTKGLGGRQKEIAEALNSIGSGLDAAVEKSIKSERLKTDLITNVSHDIKTPLTSIINYVNLLKNENFDDPKIQRYIEVLEEKAERLKTLTEDVVEASKVSSGNITLEYMNINMVEMVQQTSGEFEEKFEARHLQEILSLPKEDVTIRVDGRRMWRILGNIYNNAAKYAMEGSRIYADLRVENGRAVFSLKNVSAQPLNISADELTERFIRGDISRSTEGSGLGLSIAKTLTTMQGGTFDLYLDGDLFKVTITFPVV